MHHVKFFLAVEMDGELKKTLEQNNPYLVSYLTSGGNYLTLISENNASFLAKPAPNILSINELESLELHLLSLLKKLAPGYTVSKNPPVLITCL